MTLIMWTVCKTRWLTVLKNPAGIPGFISICGWLPKFAKFFPDIGAYLSVKFIEDCCWIVSCGEGPDKQMDEFSWPTCSMKFQFAVNLLASHLLLQAFVAWVGTSWHQQSMERTLEVGLGGQCTARGRPHNPTTGLCSSSTTVVSPEPFPHRTRSLQCL